MIIECYANKDRRDISEIAFLLSLKLFIAMQINKLHHTEGEKAIQILCFVLIKAV